MGLTAFIKSPHLFPCVMLVMMAAAAVRWAFAENWPQVAYWGFSFGLVMTCSFFLKGQ